MKVWHLHSVSGAVGAQHRHRHMASIMPSLSSLSTYLNTSSTFWPPVPSTRQPSTSASQGFVTLSNQPVAPAFVGSAPYARADGNSAVCSGCWG